MERGREGGGEGVWLSLSCARACLRGAALSQSRRLGGGGSRARGGSGVCISVVLVMLPLLCSEWGLLPARRDQPADPLPSLPPSPKGLHAHRRFHSRRLPLHYAPPQASLSPSSSPSLSPKGPSRPWTGCKGPPSRSRPPSTGTC